MAERKTTVLTYIKVDFWFLLLFIVIHIAATFTKSLYFLLYVCSVCVMKKNAALGPLSKISMYAKNTKVKHLSVHCNSVDVFVRCCHVTGRVNTILVCSPAMSLLTHEVHVRCTQCTT